MPNSNRVERTHLRHANSKHFLLDNGQSQVEVYLQPVHYLDDAGVWRDIESTLRASGDYVRCVNRRAPVRLSRFADGRVTIDDRQGRSISYRPVGPAHVKGSHAKNVLTHTDAWPEADLQWITSPSGLVKLLTLKSADAPSSYLFNVAAQGLTLAQGADGIIRARAGEEIVFVLTPPWCHDSAGVDGPVSYALEGGAIRISVDPAWLGESGRAFPVEVDPTTIQPAAAAGKDTYVDSYIPATNYGTSQALRCGRRFSTYEYIYRTLVAFDLAAYMERGATDAALWLYCYASGEVTARAVTANRITATWDQLTATWANQPAHTAVDAASTNVGAITQWYSWTVTAIFNNWLDSVYSNHGLKVIGVEVTDNTYHDYRSSDYSPTDPTLCPKLVFTLRDQPVATPSDFNGTVGAPDACIDDVSPLLPWDYTDSDADPQTRYQVQLYTATGDLVVESGTVLSADPNYQCAANLLDYGVTYKWRVRTHDGYGWGEWSSWVYFTTDLSAPTTVVATGHAAAAHIDLTWDAHAGEDLYGYIVYRKLHDADDATYVRVNYTSVTTNAFTDDTAQTAIAYAYAVTAVANDGFESDKSTHADGTVTFAGYWVGATEVMVRPTPRPVRPRLGSARVALDGSAVNQDYGYGPRQKTVELRYDTIAGQAALFDLFPTGTAVSYRDEKGYVIRGTLIGDVQEEILEIPGATTVGWLTFTIAEVTA